VKFVRAALAALATVAGGCAFAAEDPAACRDCGVVQDIRRLALPTRPRVDPLAPGPGLPRSGAPTATTPLFSIGTGGIQRVDPYESAPGQQKVVWEVTVRYDNGAFGVTRVEQEPDLKVGERVRLIESGTENQLQRLPPPKP
jgi:hypothetical protein